MKTTIIIYRTKTFAAIAVANIGEEILETILREASLMFTKKRLPAPIYQTSDANYIFLQSSGLEKLISDFNLGYDADRIREEFNALFNSAK